MFQLIKKIISFLWRQKKNLLFVFFLTFFFFALRFPWTNLLKKKIQDIQKKSSNHLQVDFDDLNFTFFPPGLEFVDLSFLYKEKNFAWDRFYIFPRFRKWLALKKAWTFHIMKANSSIYIHFWKTKKKSKEAPESFFDYYFVKAFSSSLNLKSFEDIFSNKIKASGKVNFQLNYEGPLERFKESKASLDINGKQIFLSEMEVKTHLGSINVPPINWQEGEIKFQLKEGTLLFKKFRLGSASDDFKLQIKGHMEIKRSYNFFKIGFYDIRLQMDIDKKMEMKLLHLMFDGYKEDKGDFFRYQLRLQGQGKELPEMKKINQF